MHEGEKGFGRNPGTEAPDQGQSGTEDETPTTDGISNSRNDLSEALVTPEDRLTNSVASDLGVPDAQEPSPEDDKRILDTFMEEMVGFSAEFTRLGGRLHELEEFQEEIRALVEALQRGVNQSGTANEESIRQILRDLESLKDRLEATQLEQLRSNTRLFNMQRCIRRMVAAALVLTAIGITGGTWSTVARWMEAWEKKSRTTRRLEPERMDDQPIIFAIPAMVPPKPDEDTSDKDEEDKDKKEEGYEEPVNGFKVRKNVVGKLRKLHGLDQRELHGLDPAEQPTEPDSTRPDSEPTLDPSRYPTHYYGLHLPPRPGITDTCIRLGYDYYVVEREGGHYRFTFGSDERIAHLNSDGSVEWQYPHNLPPTILEALGNTLAGNEIAPTPISTEERIRIMAAISVMLNHDGYDYYALTSSFEEGSFQLKRRQNRIKHGLSIPVPSKIEFVQLDDASLQKLQNAMNQKIRSARIVYVSEPPKEIVQEHSQELGESKGEPFKDVPSEWYPERVSSPESGSIQAETPPPSQERTQAEPDLKPTTEDPLPRDPKNLVKRVREILAQVQLVPENAVVTSSVALRQRLCARAVTVRNATGEKIDYFLTAEDIEVLSNGTVRIKPNVQVWKRGEDLHGVGHGIIEEGSDLAGDLGDILSDRAAVEMEGKQDKKTP